MHRNQLHLCNQISLGLHGRHKGSWPGRSVFNKRSGEGDTGTVRITDCMSSTGIRNTCHDIRGHMISLSQKGTTVVTHLLNTDSLVGGRGISVIYPKEGTNLHILSGICQSAGTLRCQDNNFSGTQLSLIGITKI